MFAFILFIQRVSGGLDLQALWPMLVLIVINAAAFIVVGRSSSATLGVFACLAAMLCGSAMVTHGSWALWSLVAIGLFNSVMWSNIFTLAIEGLKEDTSQGSSLLVMMIAGGAVIPKFQGLMADSSWGLQISFVVPLVCYAYLAWYGFISSSHTSAIPSLSEQDRPA